MIAGPARPRRLLLTALCLSACVEPNAARDAGRLPSLDAFVPDFLCASDDDCRALRGPGHRCEVESQLCYLPGTCDPRDVTLARCPEGGWCASGSCSCAPGCRAHERCLHGACRADVEGSCCSHDDCVALRGEGWLCEPETRHCYRPGECDETDPSVAPCARGAQCLGGRCECAPFGGVPCRLDEECDSRFSAPECVARFARPLCIVDSQCPVYSRCEQDAIGGYCVLRDGFCEEPPPTHAGCEDASPIEPPAHVVFEGELLAAPACEHEPSMDVQWMRWYRVRVPPGHGLGVAVRGGSSPVQFYPSCALDAPCEPFVAPHLSSDLVCWSLTNTSSAEHEVYAAVSAAAESGAEIYFTLSRDASGCESL